MCGIYIIVVTKDKLTVTYEVRNAKVESKQNFSWQNCAKKTLRVYEDALRR